METYLGILERKGMRMDTPISGQCTSNPTEMRYVLICTPCPCNISFVNIPMHTNAYVVLVLNIQFFLTGFSGPLNLCEKNQLQVA